MLANTLLATPLNVTRLVNYADLQALKPEWNELSGSIPFRRHEWLATWWRHYRTERDELFVLAVRDARGDLVGLAPWYLNQSRGRGRVLRWLGSGEVCSDYLTIFCRPSCERHVAKSLAQWLSSAEAGAWDLIELTGVDAADGTVANLYKRLERNGYVVHRQSDTSCWRATLPDDWDQYLATLSKSRRERARQLVRRGFDAGRAVLRLAESQADVRVGFEILVDLHQKRRRSLSQVGCFASRQFTALHREVAERMFHAGLLRLLWIELHGRPVAVEYSLIGGDTVYYYQGGFDPALADERPGWLSFAASLKLAIDEGYRHFDFLRGDESYKASWGAEPRPCVQIRVVGRRRGALLRHVAWRSGRNITPGASSSAAWARRLGERMLLGKTR